jgi:hypothetical protein
MEELLAAAMSDDDIDEDEDDYDEQEDNRQHDVDNRIRVSHFCVACVQLIICASSRKRFKCKCRMEYQFPEGN